MLLLCIDDLRPELACFGVDYIKSPNIDKLAERGRVFHRHYVQAPTCGASRCTLLTGKYGPYGNDALFKRARKLKEGTESISPSLPAWFRRHGYTTVSVGKVSHHPGGRGGPDWDDPSLPEMPNSWDRHLMPTGAWQHPRGAMHGLARGEIRVKRGNMDVFQSTEGPDTIYPGRTHHRRSALAVGPAGRRSAKVPVLSGGGHYSTASAVWSPGEIHGALPRREASLRRPHPEKPKGKSTWHGSGEFMAYNRWGRDPNVDPEFAMQVRRHYAACVSYADAMVGRLLARLDQRGLRDNTVVILWGDHGWHLGEHAIWGKHTLFDEALHSPLIVSYPGVSNAGKAPNPSWRRSTCFRRSAT